MARALLSSLPRDIVIPTHMYSRSSRLEYTLDNDVLPWSTFPQIPEDTDVIFLAVPDDAIHGVSSEMIGDTDVIVIHHSGAGALELIDERYERKGVLWPIQSLDSDVPSLGGVPLIYDGSNDEVVGLLSDICSIISDVYHCCDVHRRRRLHMGAVLSNNFSHHLLEITSELCKEIGLDAGEMYGPIMSDLLDDFHAGRLEGQQTGPAIRRDHATMDSHLEALEDEDLKRLYRSISTSIIKRNS